MLDWQHIYWVHSSALESVLQKYDTVFSEGLGTCTGFKAKIQVDPNANPRFCKARSVPYYFRDKVEKELQKLVNEEHSNQLNSQNGQLL